MTHSSIPHYHHNDALNKSNRHVVRLETPSQGLLANHILQDVMQSPILYKLTINLNILNDDSLASLLELIQYRPPLALQSLSLIQRQHDSTTTTTIRSIDNNFEYWNPSEQVFRSLAASHEQLRQSLQSLFLDLDTSSSSLSSLTTMFQNNVLTNLTQLHICIRRGGDTARHLALALAQSLPQTSLQHVSIDITPNNDLHNNNNNTEDEDDVLFSSLVQNGLSRIQTLESLYLGATHLTFLTPSCFQTSMSSLLSSSSSSSLSTLQLSIPWSLQKRGGLLGLAKSLGQASALKRLGLSCCHDATLIQLAALPEGLRHLDHFHLNLRSRHNEEEEESQLTPWKALIHLLCHGLQQVKTLQLQTFMDANKNNNDEDYFLELVRALPSRRLESLTITIMDNDDLVLEEGHCRAILQWMARSEYLTSLDLNGCDHNAIMHCWDETLYWNKFSPFYQQVYYLCDCHRVGIPALLRDEVSLALIPNVLEKFLDMRGCCDWSVGYHLLQEKNDVLIPKL